jgi:hypothetical protein
MRQFSYLLVVLYLVLGLGTGVATYAEGEKSARPENERDQRALEATMAGLAWPFHILDILAGHDAR